MTEPLDQRRPFTTSQFTRSGGDPCHLRRAAFTRLMKSVWVRADAVDDDTMFRAALLLHPPSAFLSGLSAAKARGLPVPDHAFVHVSVFRPQDRRWRPQLKPHVTTKTRRVSRLRGMRVADPIHIFIDCAGVLPLVELVVLGDAIVKRFSLNAAGLLAACRASTDYYAGLATTAAEYVRDGVDSPMESRTRMLIVLAGLPEPEVNHCVYWPNGDLKRRYDMRYRKARLIIEFDGRQHAESTRQWNTDLERREEIDDAGERIIVVTARGIYREPERTLQRIYRQLVLRGWGDVQPIGEGWRDHFADPRRSQASPEVG